MKYWDNSNFHKQKPTEKMEVLISVCLGLGLSASSGFRIFVPMLVANIAALSGHYHFSQGFEWMGTWTAFGILATATISEIAAYYIPWLDNALDHIALPVAIGAGTLLTTSFLSADLTPALKWGLGLVAGGGTAGIIHAGTGLLRLGSTATTGGIANPVISTAENGIAVFISLLTFVIPVIVAGLVILLLVFIIKKLLRLAKKRGPV